MTSVMLFCILLPLFALLGSCLVAQARRFICHIEGVLPVALPFSLLLMMLFAVVASLVSLRGLLLAPPWPLIFRDLMLLGWSVLFTQLDLARGWLPLRFTGGFILSGLLFALLPHAPLPFFQVMREGGVMFLVLSLFRCWANRGGVERLGWGDVYLLSGFSVWLSLPVTAVLTLARHPLCPLSLRLSCRGYVDTTTSFVNRYKVGTLIYREPDAVVPQVRFCGGFGWSDLAVLLTHDPYVHFILSRAHTCSDAQ